MKATGELVDRNPPEDIRKDFPARLVYVDNQLFVSNNPVDSGATRLRVASCFIGLRVMDCIRPSNSANVLQCASAHREIVTFE